MAYDGQEIFGRIGVLIKWFNQLESSFADLDTIQQTAISRYDSGAADRVVLTRIGGQIAAQQEEIRLSQQSIVSLVEEYLTDDLKQTLNSTYSETHDLLLELHEGMREASTPDFVNGNLVTATAPVQDADNHRQDGNADNVSLTQIARNESYFDVVCVDDSQVDQERWAIHNSLLGEFPGSLLTGENFIWDQAGISAFSIDPLSVTMTGDTGSQLSQWSLTGLLRGDNTDEQGRLHVEIEKTPASLSETGDENNQLNNWSFSGVTTGNSSSGLLSVRLERQPAAYTTTQNLGVTLSDWSLAGATKAGNTDSDGKLYVNVTFAAGSYTASVYSNPQRSNKVAEGNSVGPLPATITLAEQSASGLSGSVVLVGYSSDALDVVLSVPFHYVRLYDAAFPSPPGSWGITPTLVAEGVSFGPAKTGLNLAEKNNSGLTGSVDLDYGEDDDDILLTLPLHLVRLYRADPTLLTDAEKDAFLVAYGASFAAMANGMSILPQFDSGVSGSVSLNYTGDATGIVLELGWRAGDKWTFKTSSDNVGVFQNFFRDQFAVALPAKTDSSETISDGLAQ